MAERDFTKTIKMTNAITGDRHQSSQLYYQLIASLQKADDIDIIVSFLMESGVKMLIKDLEKALERGAKIRILTGNYLGITEPSALYLIKHQLKNKVDLRFYNDKSRSFHPKSYIFHYRDHSEIFVGSSNISRSALTSGIEWNYRFSSDLDLESYQQFYQTFIDLFEHHSIIIDDDELKRYSKSWHRPAVSRDIDKYQLPEDVKVIYEPRGAQIEALCALEQTRQEGAKRALVLAATGVGKTYLAAFDSKNFKRILFVAHREEILKQAAESFANVRHTQDYGFFNGTAKSTKHSLIFASVSTLGKSEYLNDNYFTKDYFDYIVIDEFHHVASDQYQSIVNYFKPRFLLGLTATPERMDGRNIYEICDYNVPYEITLRDAINKGMLVPFHYYGIYDDTDYSKMRLVKGRYVEEDLNKSYIGNNHRHDLIYKYYRKYQSKSALGFCCSRAHAKEMAKEFNRRGIPSVAVYSNADDTFSKDRAEAIRQLSEKEIRVIFCVDMFNEGVDIPSIDMVMFLRPTDSPVVFLQQLGRGLRRDDGKEYLNVLDFIGNYAKAGRTRQLLTGSASYSINSYSGVNQDFIPDGCIIDFDMQLIDLFAEMERKSLKLRDHIHLEYERVKDMLGHSPSRVELFTYMDDDIYRLCITHSKDNPFKHYLDYRHDFNDLTPEEEKLYNSIGREFISLIENTNMSKVYKMPVLLAFYNHGQIRQEVHEDELLESWKEFFDTGTNWKDLEKDITYDKYKSISDKSHIKKIIQMPIRYLEASGKGFFIKKEGSILALCDELKDISQTQTFIEQMYDAIYYRVLDYYYKRYNDQS